MSSLREALRGSGAQPPCRGDVHLVADDELRLTRNAPPGGGSKHHRAIVIGEPSLLQDSGFPFAWIVPCTTSPDFRDGLLEVVVQPGESGFTKPAFAISYLVQPLRKSRLGPRVGTVSEGTLEVVLASVALVLDLLPVAADGVVDD